MRKQKCIIVSNSIGKLDSNELNNYLKEGWFVHSMISQKVSTGADYTLRGDILVIIEKVN